jgi:hypothetical protein
MSEHFRLEGQMSLARLTYKSPISGRIHGVHQSEGSLQLLGPALTAGSGGKIEPSVQWHYTYNDLRGPSSTGQRGYERHLNNLWVGARWSQSLNASAWPMNSYSIDLQSLVQGRQQSKVSQADPSYSDVLTKTPHGWALGVQGTIPTAHGYANPYLRLQRLNRSNTVFNGVGYATEPANDKVWMGVNWWFN